MDQPFPLLETLLEQEDFVRLLARSLLSDESQVDDVVQDAWLKAYRSPPRRPGALRQWLATVTRRLATLESSRNQAREKRERLAARPELYPVLSENPAGARGE